MHNSKLITLIKTLNDEELVSLGHFLASPYFNRNKKAADLFSIIKPHSPNYDSDLLKKEAVFAELFPDKKKDGSNLTQLMTELTKLVKSFLAQENYRKAPYQERLSLMNELLHRNNINALKEELVTEQNRLQRADNKQDIDFFCWQYEVSLLEFSYNIRTHNRDMSASACDWLNATDCYIVLLKLRTLVGALSRKNVLKQDYCIRWQQEIINSVEKEPFSNIPLLQMYRLVVLLLTNAADSTTYYDELRILLKEHHHQIGHSELLQLYVLCINYELKRTKEHGNNAENIFSLYKEMDSSSVFDHHIQNVLYTHAIKFAAQVQQFKWADTFLEKYKDKIAVENTNDREYIYNYSRALWHFHKGDLKGAMYLLGTEYPDAYYYMERKVTLMKIYYQIETKEDDLFNEIKAVKTYLSRDKTMADHNKVSCTNFVRLLEKLIKLAITASQSTTRNRVALQQKKQQLLEELQSTQPLYEGQWLIDMVNKIS